MASSTAFVVVYSWQVTLRSSTLALKVHLHISQTTFRAIAFLRHTDIRPIHTHLFLVLILLDFLLMHLVLILIDYALFISVTRSSALTSFPQTIASNFDTYHFLSTISAIAI